MKCFNFTHSEFHHGFFVQKGDGCLVVRNEICDVVAYLDEKDFETMVKKQHAGEIGRIYTAMGKNPNAYYMRVKFVLFCDYELRDGKVWLIPEADGSRGEFLILGGNITAIEGVDGLHSGSHISWLVSNGLKE